MKLFRRYIRSKCERGFTVLEVMIITSMMMTVLATVTVGLKAGHTAKEEMRRRDLLTVMSSDIMDRLFQVPFGNPGDEPPSPAELSELFDDDDFLGPVTLSGLRVPAGMPGFTFELANFPYNGTWEVRVAADLNADGDEEDENEGRDDLFRVNILYDGVLILETMRSEPI